MQIHRSLAPAVALVVAALIGAACTAAPGAGSPSPTTTPSTAPTESAAPSASATESATAGEVALEVEPGEGDIPDHLVDAEGMTLYVFTVDPKDTDTSACVDQCLENWPALIVDSADEVQAGMGVDGEITTITRPDSGDLQVSYDGQPLYYFKGDEQPGDTNGQGLNEVWFVAEP